VEQETFNQEVKKEDVMDHDLTTNKSDDKRVGM